MSIPPKAPPVYRPTLQKIAGPPVYRPQVTQPAHVQLKPANIFTTETRPAPPVYRPSQATTPSAQLKPANNLRLETRPAPPVYRPQAVLSVASTPKWNPPLHRPIQAKGVGGLARTGNGDSTARVGSGKAEQQGMLPNVGVEFRPPAPQSWAARQVKANNRGQQLNWVQNSILQPKVIIKEISPYKALPPTGKDSKIIWEDLKFDVLDKKLAHHGLKAKYFTKLLKEEKSHVFDTTEEFRQFFIENILSQFEKEEELAKQENERNIPKKERTKRTIRRFTLSRPAWPEDYRKKLGALPGHDIRHVVRNATLKRALEDERKFLEQETNNNREALNQYYNEMAKALGVFASGHYMETVRSIYNKVYLHLGNLFPEAGGVNRAIGFSADPITQKGEELEAMEDALVDIDDVSEFVWNEIFKQVKSNQTRAEKLRQKNGNEATEAFLKGLTEYAENLKSFLHSLYVLWQEEYGIEYPNDETRFRAEAWNLADDLIDIGQNFGFDLILTEDKYSNIAERQSVLIKVETALQQKAFKPGTQQLTEIFKTFLSVPGHETRTDTPSISSRLNPKKKKAKKNELQGIKKHISKKHRYSESELRVFLDQQNPLLIRIKRVPTNKNL